MDERERERKLKNLKIQYVVQSAQEENENRILYQQKGGEEKQGTYTIRFTTQEGNKE